MGLFNKKKEVPEIPPAPQFIDMDSNKDFPSIPSIDVPAKLDDKKEMRIPSLNDARATALELPKSEISSEKNDGESGDIIPHQFQESTILKEKDIPPTGIPIPPVKQTLPELPKYSKKDDSMMKTVASELNHSETMLPEPPQKMVSEKKLLPSIESEEISSAENMNSPVKKDFNETIFVRIDKFNSAKKDLQEMQKDLQRIQELIMEINEIKLKEDEEIVGLNKNIEEIKDKLDKMDTEIFNRI